MTFKMLYNIWLYYVEKEKWKSLIFLYDSLSNIDPEILFQFKKYVDSQNGACNDHIHLMENIPSEFKKIILKIFFKNKSKINSKIHIITDIDDTIIKSCYNYNLPGHDYSAKMYPYILNYIQQFIFENKKSSKFITMCSMRPTYLSDYSKSHFSHIFENNIHTIMATPFIFLYHSFMTLFYIHTQPFTPDWYQKYKIAGHTKYSKIKLFSQIYPELNLVFIGDTGEGDLITAILLFMNKKINMSHIFLHDIKNKENKSYIKENQQLLLFNNKLKVVKKNKKLLIYENNVNTILPLFEIFLFENLNETDIQHMIEIISKTN